ncbi:MAG: hypothetical protein ILA34_00025 [Bacteroidaceae bacterium]|nr:hypothetical protein [Bacteroidaceae bacterium]
MKRMYLFLAFLSLLGMRQVNAQVLDLNFTASGIQNSAAANAYEPGSNAEAAVLYNPAKDLYMGSTDRTKQGCFYFRYDLDDAIGQAFKSGKNTWEFLFRLDKNEGYHSEKSNGTKKIFSSEQGGGWSFIHYSQTKELQLEYGTDNGSGANQYIQYFANEQIVSGKFYHVVCTINTEAADKADACSFYINGKKCAVTNNGGNLGTEPFMVQNGTTKGVTGMWGSLGGDVQGWTTAPATLDNSNASTFVFARVYDKALTDEEAAALYTDKVKEITEPVQPADGLMLDAVFDETGAKDASLYSAETQQLKTYGTLKTQYNSLYKRYEGVFSGFDTGDNTKNYSSTFLKRDVSNDPTATGLMGDAFTIEAYCQANSANPEVTMSPISMQQAGGVGFEFQNSGNIAFNCNTYGYKNSTNSCGGGLLKLSTGAGVLTTGYTHYALVFDRLNSKSYMYINGKLVKEADNADLSPYHILTFTYGPYGWWAVGGDARSNTDGPCDFPWNGQISIARVWTKALSAEEVAAKCAEAQKAYVTIGEKGYTTLCLPNAAKLPAGVTAYAVTNWSGDRIDLKKAAGEGDILAAGVPVVLKGAAGTEYTLEAAINPESAITPDVNYLKGTLNNDTVDTKTAFVLGNGKNVATFGLTADTILPSNIAYLPKGEGSDTLLYLCVDGQLEKYSKLVDITFDMSGTKIHDNGTRADAASKVGLSGNANSLENPYDTDYPYYGCSNPTASSYFYGTFDKGDELATAFDTAATWEFLVRIENLIAAGGSGLLKFLSCQEAGGWTFYNNQAGLYFDYLTTEGTSRATYSTDAGTLIPGKFYHVVATMDKATKEIKLYVNGSKPVTAVRTDGNWQLPNCGTTAGEKDVWFGLGGDPNGKAATEGACENSTGSTFVFARVYNGALSESEVAMLYNDKVKKYTEPAKPNTEDLIFDAVFNKDGAADASAYSSIVPLEKMGEVPTAYNSNLQRYEAKFATNGANYFRYNLAAEPSILDQMADGYAWEVYCKVPSTTPGSVRPIGYEMSSYGGGLHLRNAEAHIAWQTFTGGYNSSNEYEKPGWRWVNQELPTSYTHYVAVYDRKSGHSKFYQNGVQIDDHPITKKEGEAFYWAPGAWVAIGGNANNWYRANVNCNSPYNGEIAIARFWGKALSATDVTALYNSASSTSHTLSMDTTGFTTLCLPMNYTLPAGVTALIAKQQGDSTVVLDTLAVAGETVPYGTPVILAADKGIYTLDAADITAVTPKEVSGNLLEGSFASKNATTGEVYAMTYGQSGKPLFIISEDENIKANSAWLPAIGGEDIKYLVVNGDTLIDKAVVNVEPEPEPEPEPDPNKKDQMTFVVMGNSISTYENYQPAGYAVYYSTSRGFNKGIQVGDTWWMQLSRMSGMSYLNNVSWSGSRVTYVPGVNANSVFTSDERVNAVGRAGIPDAIIIAGGTNDWSNGTMALGEYSTKVFNDSLTFRGSYTMLLHKLRKRYPRIKLFCCSIFPRQQAATQANASGWTQNDANESIKHIADQFGGYYVDCTKAPLTDDIPTNYIDYGLHPSAAGHKLLAEAIYKSLLEQGAISDTLKKTTEVAEAEKLLDLSFDKDGIVNKGTFQTTVGQNGAATTVYDPTNDKYYGTTSMSNKDYFYALYDKEDTLGHVLNNSVTWETLVRLENLSDPSGSGNVVKFFSNQEDGGWTFYNTPKNITFAYLTESDGVYSIMKHEVGDSTMIAGKFYHLVVTLDRASHTMRFIVNGKLVATGTRVANDLRYPNCGTTLREKDMWIGLGGDPGAYAATGDAQNGAATTFVFARIYNAALTEEAALALYNDEVKKFTEPTKPNTTDLIMDAVFSKEGAKNASAYSIPLEQQGTVTTAYNADRSRYEAQFSGSSDDFYKFFLGSEPSIIHQMADAYSVEVYCQAESATPSSSMRPVSFLDGYGSALHMNAAGNIAYGTITYGYDINSTFKKYTWDWTGNGKLTADYNHYVMVFDRTKGLSKLYINGAETISRSFTTHECIYMDNAATEWMAIGGTPGGPYATSTTLSKYPFKGNVGIARIWGKALSLAEVKSLSTIAAQPTANVKMESTGYQMVCLPYAYTVPEGVTAYIVNEQTDNTVTLKPIAWNGSAVPYGTPVILKGEAKATYTLAAVNTDTVTVEVEDLSDNLLEGSFAQKQVALNAVYYLDAASGTAVLKSARARTLAVNKCWLPNTGGAASKTFIELVPDGIHGIQAGASGTSGSDVYNLQGQKVSKPTRGIYIVNGKKVFVK